MGVTFEIAFVLAKNNKKTFRILWDINAYKFPLDTSFGQVLIFLIDYMEF